jgi:hypothetical protein
MTSDEEMPSACATRFDQNPGSQLWAVTEPFTVGLLTFKSQLRSTGCISGTFTQAGTPLRTKSPPTLPVPPLTFSEQ